MLSPIWNYLFVAVLPATHVVAKLRGNVTDHGAFREVRECRLVRAIAPIQQKETDVLKKTCAVGGLVIATAAGTLIMSSPAPAATPAWGGGGWGFGGHRAGLFNRGGAFAGNENALFNRIRLRIRNRNNNVAINNQRQHEQQREFQRQRLLPVNGATTVAAAP